MQKKRVQLLSLLLTLIMVFVLFPVHALAADREVTVYISFEGYAVGHGFYIEPTRLMLPAGSTGEDATRRLLAQTGHTFDADDTWGFFLNRMYGFNAGAAVPPEIIMDKINEGVTDWQGTPLALNPDGNADGSLGTGDYLGLAGWMVTVNHQLLPTGINEHTLASGDVLRWQFSLLGGDDLGLGPDQGFWAEPLYTHTDKNALIRALYMDGVAIRTRQAALAVIIDPTATAQAVAAAIAAITFDSEMESTIADTVKFLMSRVPNPGVGSVGGEWLVLGIARSGHHVPESFFEDYYRAVEQYVTERDGVLDIRRITEYSRIILGLTAAGFDPRNVTGFNLTEPLGDFDQTIWQGLNGAIFALLALDSRAYPIPEDQNTQTQATREMYVDEILRRQSADGGWRLFAGTESSDADVTGMALQALAKYQNRPDAAEAIERALSFLSGIQDADGGFPSEFTQSESAIESVVQVLVALGELGISIDDPRFVKNGSTVLDNILSFRNPDGGFRHAVDGIETSLMATEQALHGLVAVRRVQEGGNSLYRMSDSERRFADVTHNNWFFDYVRFAYTNGLMQGVAPNRFSPRATLTQAMVITILWRLEGEPAAQGDSAVYDVQPGQWYTEAVIWASENGIVQGVGSFVPGDPAIREQIALFFQNFAAFRGLDTGGASFVTEFTDVGDISSWARDAMAWANANGIITGRTETTLAPQGNASRAEFAAMLQRFIENITGGV
jgi:hypothetical protein